MEKIPFVPADPEPIPLPASPLGDAQTCRSIIAAILIKGGCKSLALTQEDMNAVAKLVLLDGRTHEGDLLVALGVRDAQGVVHPFDPNITQGH